MRISEAYEVNNVISLYSRGNDRVENLLQRSVGRLAREQFLSDKNAIVDVDPDILQLTTDWFEKACSQEGHWLLGNHGNLKLTQISNYSELEEAAKDGIKQLAQPLQPIQFEQPNEELICDLPHGYSAVKLLSKSAVKAAYKSLYGAESDPGFYKLNESNECIVIRNKEDVAKVALEISHGIVERVFGENYKVPKPNIIEAIAALCKLQGYNVLLPSSYIEHVVDRAGNWYHISDIPEQFDGHLRLNSLKDVVLPKKLHVNGQLVIWNSTIKTSPEQIVAKSFTYSQSTGLKMPETLMISGDLDFSESDISVLPQYLQTKGRVNVSGTAVKALPRGFSAKEVFADKGQITEFDRNIPDELVIGNMRPRFHMTTVGKIRKDERRLLARLFALFRTAPAASAMNA